MKDVIYTILNTDDIKEFNKYSFEECNDIVNKTLDKYENGKDVDNIYANMLICILKRKKYVNDNTGNEKSQEYIDTVNGYNKIIDVLRQQLQLKKDIFQYKIIDIDNIKEFNKYSLEECDAAISKALDKYEFGKDADNIFANIIMYKMERKRYINNNIENEKSQEYIDIINGYDKIINALEHQLQLKKEQ